MNCSKCGAEIAEGFQICEKCGALVETAKVSDSESSGNVTEASDSAVTELQNAKRTKYDVFISHSSKNKNIADAICANFERHGIKCWYAPRDIAPGESWPSAIKAGITEAKVFVLVFSENSNESKQVTNEVAMAYSAEKTIIPFKISETQMNDDLEYFLNRVHWLDALSEPLEKNIDEMRKYTEQILGHSGDGTTLSYTPTVDGTQIHSQASKPDEKSVTESEKKRDGKKKFSPMKLAAILLPIIVVLCCGCFILAGPGAKKLMEDGKEAFYSQYHGSEDNDKARELFTKAAKKGEADAYYYLGCLDLRVFDYTSAQENFKLGVEAGSDLARLGRGSLALEGWEGATVNMEEARSLFEEALANGCVEANYYLGQLTEEGLAGMERDGNTSIEYYKKSAESEELSFASNSCANLGNIYRNGATGVEKDLDEANLYYRKALEKNSSQEGYVNLNLARIYEANEEADKAEECYDKALEFYLASAEKGSLQPLNNIGYLYATDEFDKYDIVEAVRWFKMAAEAGSSVAMYNIANFYRDGKIGNESDYNTAVQYYKDAADLGYTNAMNALGDLYNSDKLGDADYEEAAKWYEKAANAGHINAANSLGILYHNGEVGKTGDTPDYEEAAKWYEKAIEGNSSAATYNMGLLYNNGYIGKEPDYNTAAQYYQDAADLGSTMAMNALGNLYNSDKLGDADYEEAAKWYEKAANAGHINAANSLGALYHNGKVGKTGDTPDYEEAAKWYEKAIEGGNASAMNSLGNIYFYGYIGEVNDTPNYEEAKSLYEKAIEAGDKRYAPYNLGNLYNSDKLGTPDYVKAESYYKMAAENGNDSAMNKLGIIYGNGELGEADYQKALEMFLKASKTNTNEALYIYNAGVAYRDLEDYDNALIYYGKAIDMGYEDADNAKAAIQKMVKDGHVTAEAASKWLDK